MEFEYTVTKSIYIEEDDLREMRERVKKGEKFERVFEDIMLGYDDDAYYDSGYIREDVKEEILKTS